MSLSSKKTVVILLLATLLGSCGLFTRFDPQAPMIEKWKTVQKWVPNDFSYLVVADLNRLASTEFYKKVLEDQSIKDSILFGGIEPSTDIGLAAFSDGLFYIGGRFKSQLIINKIKENSLKDGLSLDETAYFGKNIYTDASTNYAFTFLEKYLICQGAPEKIKALIDRYNKKDIIPAEISTNKVVSGQLTNKMPIYGKITAFNFEADIARGLKLSAIARLPSKEDSQGFMDEIAGIRAIKTIQSIDEPWLAEIIDNIDISREDLNINLKIELSPELSIDILKRVMK